MGGDAALALRREVGPKPGIWQPQRTPALAVELKGEHAPEEYFSMTRA